MIIKNKINCDFKFGASQYLMAKITEICSRSIKGKTWTFASGLYFCDNSSNNNHVMWDSNLILWITLFLLPK